MVCGDIADKFSFLFILVISQFLWIQSGHEQTVNSIFWSKF